MLVLARRGSRTARQANRRGCASHVVEQLAGRGRGVVASRGLAEGEAVFTESPLVWVSVDSAHWAADLERTGLPKEGTAGLVELCTQKKLKYPLLAAQLARVSVTPAAGGFHPFWQRVGGLCYADGVTDVPSLWVDAHKLIQNSFEPTGGTELFDTVLDQQWFAQVHSILPLNCMRLEAFRPVTALFQEASMFNHSCQSNVEVHTESAPGHEGWQAVFRTVRDVEEGEELCLGYDRCKMGEDRKTFQQRLSDNYGFECTCPECVDCS
eukprot:TRINITY_DN39443_c0_g1_i1.p1 TRINITY_DN39443_c0_g1~~TRINITY_DN39443_c0_g1_i1.p1  ORF type:complete len:267 (+),score=36.09 TRINITY_DN39443_c0_g1_i1:117-917(+)